MKKITILIFCVSILFVSAPAVFAADVIHWYEEPLTSEEVIPGTGTVSILKLREVNESTAPYVLQVITITFCGVPNSAPNIASSSVKLWRDNDGNWDTTGDRWDLPAGSPQSLSFVESPAKVIFTSIGDTLTAGSSTYFFVTCDISTFPATEGDTIDVKVNAASDIGMSGETVTGDFPLNSAGTDTVKVNATKYKIDVSSEATAGVAFPVNVWAVDSFGNIDKNYNSAGASTTITGDAGSIEGHYPVYPGPFDWDGSTDCITKDVTLYKTETANLWATGGGLSQSDKQSVTVSAAELSGLVLNVAKNTVAVGEELNFDVSFADEFLNPVGTATGTLKISAGNAQLSTTGYVLREETKTYNGWVVFNTEGTQTLKVEGSTVTSPASYPYVKEKQITVKKFTEVHSFKIEILADDIHAGVPFEIKITAQDEFGNPVTDFTDTVSLGTDEGIAVTPSMTGNFVDGVWQGMIRVNESGEKVTITCDDGKGHDGKTGEAKDVETYTAIEKTFNYPNPFAVGNEDTNIQYYLKEPSAVEIRIYTLTGELVRKWEFDKGSEYGRKGVNLLEWDGTDKDGNIAGSGGYICAVDKKYDSGTKRDFTKIAVIRK